MSPSGVSKAATIISEILLTVEISNVSILNSWSGVRVPSILRFFRNEELRLVSQVCIQTLARGE